jgi:hypothetical protein
VGHPFRRYRSIAAIVASSSIWRTLVLYTHYHSDTDIQPRKWRTGWVSYGGEAYAVECIICQRTRSITSNAACFDEVIQQHPILEPTSYLVSIPTKKTYYSPWRQHMPTVLMHPLLHFGSHHSPTTICSLHARMSICRWSAEAKDALSTDSIWLFHFFFIFSRSSSRSSWRHLLAKDLFSI